MVRSISGGDDNVLPRSLSSSLLVSRGHVRLGELVYLRRAIRLSNSNKCHHVIDQVVIQMQSLITIFLTKQSSRSNWRPNPSHVVEMLKVPGVDKLLQVIQLRFGGVRRVTGTAASVGVCVHHGAQVDSGSEEELNGSVGR